MFQPVLLASGGPLPCCPLRCASLCPSPLVKLLHLPLPLPVQLPPKEQIITAEPDVRHVELQPEDRFLILACDGIWDVMSKWVAG